MFSLFIGLYNLAFVSFTFHGDWLLCRIGGCCVPGACLSTPAFSLMIYIKLNLYLENNITFPVGDRHTAHVEKMTNGMLFVCSLRKNQNYFFQSFFFFFLLCRGLLDEIFMISVEYDNGIDGAKCSLWTTFVFSSSLNKNSIFSCCNITLHLSFSLWSFIYNCTV